MPPVTLDPTTRSTHTELAARLADRHQSDGCRVIGINGAQGSGKSTLATAVARILTEKHGLSALTISLDDFYLGREARTELARNIHPLMETRGVPGTHDVQRGIECLDQLCNDTQCTLPAFSKATDDVLGTEHQRTITEPPDLILFEGWCVGTPPQKAAALDDPINELERMDDPGGEWRHYVNKELAGPYSEWFNMLDALVYLQVPSWEHVRGWRTQQERETIAANDGDGALAAPAAMERFMQHYERLTQHALRALPGTAEVIVAIDEKHIHHLR